MRPEEVSVVIFGNDPYTRVEQATGRSFEQGNLTDWVKDVQVRRRISPGLKSILCAAASACRTSMKAMRNGWPTLSLRGV